MATTLKNFGVEYSMQSAEVREKSKATNLIKYGTENPMQCESVRQKIKDTNMERYGVVNVFQSEPHKDKIKNTCMERYGVENVMFDPEIAARSLKNMAKKKSYKFPSGTEVMVQGYEPFALNRLIGIEKVDETAIETQRENVPEIWYYDLSGVKHRHYVDIFIADQNRCIEVKSTWTFQLAHCHIFEKQQAAKELGMNYEVWVFAEDGTLLDTYM